MSKNIILDKLVIKKVGKPDGNTQLYSIEAVAGTVKYSKEVKIEFTDGLGHQINTLANYLEFMAKVIKRGGK